MRHDRNQDQCSMMHKIMFFRIMLVEHHDQKIAMQPLFCFRRLLVVPK
jgi:hypothetical protein